MNKLYDGTNKEIELPEGGCLIIDDEIREVKRARIFDPLRHSFNPLKDIDHKKARELATGFYTIYPQGEDTLTVRGGRRTLARMLLKFPRLDKLEASLWKKAEAHAADKKNNEPLSPAEAEVLGLVSDILLSPVLKKMLCNPTNFSFNPRSTILAKVDRAALGEDDALVIGLLLMAQFKGQIVLPDGGFYLRDVHMSLVRQKRLIVGVNTLSELPPKLRQTMMLGERAATGTTFKDAEEFALAAHLRPGTNEFNDAVDAAMA